MRVYIFRLSDLINVLKESSFPVFAILGEFIAIDLSVKLLKFYSLSLN